MISSVITHRARSTVDLPVSSNWRKNNLTRELMREDLQIELEALKVSPMQSWSWILKLAWSINLNNLIWRFHQLTQELMPPDWVGSSIWRWVPWNQSKSVWRGPFIWRFPSISSPKSWCPWNSRSSCKPEDEFQENSQSWSGAKPGSGGFPAPTPRANVLQK